ncbi:MAG: hypothetical protein GY774_17585 [Planctomycetes bacterium]|nr:hypothetical protein [Planctomycetota bacterium]
MTPFIAELVLANQMLALAQDGAEAAWGAAYADPHNELAWEDAGAAETYVAQAAERLASATAAAQAAI